MVAAGHPLTAEAGARILREGGNAVDAAVGAVLASWVAEPLLTGPGAGGYLLVAGAGRGADAAGLLRRGPRPRRRPVRRAPTCWPCEVSFGDAVQVFNCGAASCGTYGMPAGLAAALERWGSLDAAALAAPGRRDGARGRRAQRRAGLRLRDPRADPRLARRSRARPSRPTAGCCARATASARPSWPTRSSASAPRAPRRSTRGDLADAVVDWVGAGGGQLTRARPRRLRADRRARRCAPTYRGRAGPHQPAAVGRRDAAGARHGAPGRALGRRAVGASTSSRSWRRPRRCARPRSSRGSSSPASPTACSPRAWARRRTSRSSTATAAPAR